MEMLSSADMREFDTFDSALKIAVQEGSKTGSMTPIIKEELKLTILNRRFKAGQGEIEREVKKPKEKFELSKEEKKKKERRKEQNRRAATRCREKKKKLSEQVIQGYIIEQDQKKKLEQEVESLKKEKAELQRLFDEHIFMCRHFTPTPTETPPYDDSTAFTFPACSAVSPHAAEIDYQRDNTTPFSGGDHYEDVFLDMSQYMYPSTQEMTSQKTPCTAPTPVEQMDEEIILPDDFHLHLYQCTDPELEQMNGRQSISEFNDNSYMAH